MRICFREPSTPGDISELLRDLAEFGVDELQNVNIYCRLRAHGEPVEILTRSGGKVDILAVQGRNIRGYAKDHPDAPASSRKRSAA